MDGRQQEVIHMPGRLQR